MEEIATHCHWCKNELPYESVELVAGSYKKHAGIKIEMSHRKTIIVCPKCEKIILKLVNEGNNSSFTKWNDTLITLKRKIR